MGFRCVICSESLERGPPGIENAHEVRICCLPCGHMLHQYCIDTWTKGNLPTCKQCPVCRKPIPKLRTLPLYPDIHNDTAFDDSVTLTPCNHEIEISQLKREIDGLKRKAEDHEVIRKTLSDDLERERFLKKEETRKREVYHMKYVEAMSVKTHYQEVKNELELKTAELKKYENFKKAMECARNDEPCTDEDEYPVTEDSVRCLVDTKVLLTRELRLAVRRKDEISKEASKYRDEKKFLQKQLREEQAKNEKLVNELETLKVQVQPKINDSMLEPISPSVTVITNRKRKPATNIDEGAVGAEPERKVDNDVGLLKPFHQRKTFTFKSKSSASIDALPGPSKAITPASSSSARLLNKVARSSENLSSTNSSTRLNPVAEKIKDNDVNDLSPQQFHSNLKSSLIGIPDSPVVLRHVYKGSELLRPGIPKPPKVLKK